MREEILEADVEVSSMLTKTTLSLRDISELKVGDVIPVDIPDRVELMAQDVAVCDGRLGVSDGRYAIKINRWKQHSQSQSLHEYIHAFQDELDQLEQKN